MLQLLKDLCSIPGPSGAEDRVRAEILRRIQDHCETRVDPLGNIIAFKKGEKTPKNKVMFAAHMDEVGFIITHIEESGLLGFSRIGGIDARVILGKRLLVGDALVAGVIGAKPLHLLKGDEEEAVPNPDSLYIDIGARTREEAERHVLPGDFATFDSQYVEFGGGLVKARALDDRAGCTIMIEMISSGLEYDTWFAFNVQEEVGCRGAVASAYTIDPDYAVVLEATTAADIAGVEEDKQVCRLGGGPVLSFMDRSTVYDRELYRLGHEVAKKNGIPSQPKSLVAGGNESGVIHKSRGGVRTLSVSLPCRYLHSPSCVIQKDDLFSTLSLAKAVAAELAAR